MKNIRKILGHQSTRNISILIPKNLELNFKASLDIKDLRT